LFNLNLMIMKRGNLLRTVTSVAIAMFVANGVFGQIMDANLTVDETTDQYVTINKALPYHVTPDPYFNPNYDAGGGWLVTSDFLWSFSTEPGGATPVFSDNTAINPDITLDVIGDYVLDVVETSADGCAGTTRQLNIHVLAAPTFDFGARLDIEQCGDMAATDVLFDIADNTATDFLVDWTYDVDNLLADKVTLDDELAASDVTHTDDAFAAPGAGLVLANQAFPVLNSKVTRYTFTLTGINDAVSRVSDYIAPLGRNILATNFTNYAAGADNTFIIVVLPAPTTGPIYHLPNL
jgi:hypothetical protein